MELKDLFNTIGIEAENLDEFKDKFNQRFVTKESALDDPEIRSKFTGKFAGGVASHLKREFGIEASELKQFDKWEDQVKYAATKYKEKINELEEMSGKGSDEKVKELAEKLSKAEKSILDYKSNLENTSKLVEQKELEYTGQIKNIKTNYILAEAKNKLTPKMKSNMSKAEQFYFDNLIKENLVVDFDENDSPIVLDKTGKRVANPNKVGAFLTVEEAIEDIASKENLIVKNNVGQTNLNKIVSQTPQQNAGQKTPANNTREINPVFLEKRRKMGLM